MCCSAGKDEHKGFHINRKILDYVVATIIKNGSLLMKMGRE
jgi:hypothetical protein